jgi:hypothetical protein
LAAPFGNGEKALMLHHPSTVIERLLLLLASLPERFFDILVVFI